MTIKKFFSGAAAPPELRRKAQPKGLGSDAGAEIRPAVLKKGAFTMDNTVMEMKDDSLIMKIMFKAVAAAIARGFGGKKDYENPEFRMLMNSSAGRITLGALRKSGWQKHFCIFSGIVLQ